MSAMQQILLGNTYGGMPIVESAWDSGSKGAGVTISGKSATVWASPDGYVRSDQPRSYGRRVFGIKLTAVTAPQTFFAGIAALSGWGYYGVGKHWLMYGYDGNFYYYPAGSAITLSPAPGAPTSVNDIAYFDFDFSTLQCAVKLNNGTWSAPASLPNAVAGASYVIDMQAPSSSGDSWSADMLTTDAELFGHIPSGATAWDA